GAEATKEAVLRRVRDASVLYFATHGVADAVDGLNGAFLALGAPTLAQGKWTKREIEHLHLRAEVAVLSACQTGIGQVHDAGVIGVARGFQIAGAGAVVMSLWSVRDGPTARLMAGFAKELQLHSPPIALREAVLAFKKEAPDPVEWAP